MFVLVYCIKAAKGGLGWAKPQGVWGRSIISHIFTYICLCFFRACRHDKLSDFSTILHKKSFSICTVYVHVMLLLFLSDVRLSHLH